MEGKHEVWTMEELIAVVPKQDKYWLSNCGCREEKGKKCKKGLHTCLGFEPGFTSTKSGLTEASRKDVDKLLAFAKEKKLVARPWVSEDGKVKASCFCCDCCCYYITTGEGNVPGKSIEKTDMDSCTQCGACVEECHFHARAMKTGKLVVDRKKCVGCGLCVSVCPAEAIQMVKRKL